MPINGSEGAPPPGTSGPTSGSRGGFEPGFIEEVRHATGLAAIVQEHVTLKRAGRTLKGLCPFHSEKTPSFHVDEARGFYYCFGCNAGGDAFKFVMQQEALSFPEAVRHLAGRAGIAVPDTRPRTPADDLRERLVEINLAAQELFAGELASPRGSDARRYLEDRGLGADVVEGFGLGWAPDSWDFLTTRLLRRFELRELTASGMVTPRREGSGVYDRFRSRVTFPIRALSGRAIAFGGRIVGDGEPKYLNSPETPLYRKGSHLFGLDRARAAIRREGQAVLVEGFLDAISLHAHGVGTAVAVLGTALTPEQARLLGRFATRVVLNFDGDAAGQAATRKSLEVLLAEGLDVRVLSLPDGADPDDHVRREGGDSYLRALERAGSFFDFLLEAAARDHDLGSPTGRANAVSDLLPVLTRVEDRVLRSELVDEAEHRLGVRPGIVHAELRRTLRRGRTGHEGRRRNELSTEMTRVSRSERTLVGWLSHDEAARVAFRTFVPPDRIQGMPHGELFEAFLAEPPGEFDLARVLERIEDDQLRRLVGTCAMDPEPEPVERAALEERIGDLLGGLGMSPAAAARVEKAQLEREWAEAYERGDSAAAAALRETLMELTRKSYS